MENKWFQCSSQSLGRNHLLPCPGFWPGRPPSHALPPRWSGRASRRCLRPVSGLRNLKETGLRALGRTLSSWLGALPKQATFLKESVTKFRNAAPVRSCSVPRGQMQALGSEASPPTSGTCGVSPSSGPSACAGLSVASLDSTQGRGRAPARLLLHLSRVCWAGLARCDIWVPVFCVSNCYLQRVTNKV